MFSLLKLLVKGGFYIGASAVIGGGLYMHSTMPTNESLNEFLKTYTPHVGGTDTIKDVVLWTGTKQHFDDYKFFKIAKVQVFADTYKFVGIVNNWKFYGKNKKLPWE